VGPGSSYGGDDHALPGGATHAEYKQIVTDFENANDAYYAEQGRKQAQGEDGTEMLVDSFNAQNVAPEAR
jgi:hypothetical protein